ncbi:MAG: DNA repair protein RecO [Phycisphaerales bacterium]|nr:DNA repair protein RecO [Planctomycetota bacterium]
MPTRHDDAICIRVWDWSETSQTVSLFCREIGIVRGLAKGAKRDDARFSGGFELLTRGQAGVIVKSGDAMATLTSWDLAEVYPAARASLPAFYCAMGMLDVVQALIRDHDPHSSLYDALVASLRRIDGLADSAAALVQMLWSSLEECGYRPELERDVRTGEPLGEAPQLVFDARLGGFSSRRGEPGDDAWRARSTTLETLRTIAQEGAPGLTVEASVRAGKLLGAYVRELSGGRLNAVHSAWEAVLRAAS